ncbi:Putative S-adenosyl-L-methionine-dependent methyltransferase [Septoria linicola]|uniref:S-adenosyl-L-methionine-dependent methyltransferase n=1 Tax=Septoria linicola TaxID=215465 RepID=A0A9Q9EIL5_9PEZI|nr:putative S-adenosyl-L-methionine-dependent methyltransferase [Septoria linicola]USW52155.1 Putative S-adenosyl-L-methionine-dependent methyltransferase [Septoria linicola]
MADGMIDNDNHINAQGQPSAVANSSAKRAPPTSEAEERQALEQQLAAKLRGTRDYLSEKAAPSSSDQQQHIQPTSHEASETATATAGPTSHDEDHDQPTPPAAASFSSAPQGEMVMLDGGQNAEEQQLEPDELDSDSALGSDTQVFNAAYAIRKCADPWNSESRTTSLSESIWNYRTEHGRTYHAYKDGKYIFPNDEREADRLDLQHHLLRITYANKLYFSPLHKPRRCLDVGTGTGIWAVDFADEHPECMVTGIDLSPGQPTLVPPNVKFVVDDAEDAWLYQEKFDFIHARLMSGCFADWPSFIRQSYENLEPGGWLELQDYGLPVKSADGTHLGTDMLRWGELLLEAGRKIGRPLGSDVSEHFERWMEDAGFVDVQHKMFMWPSSSWPKDPFMKELGRWNQVNIIDGLEAFCLALLTRGLGWRKEEVDVFVARVSNDFRNRKIHAYFPMPVVYGRRPMPGEIPFH